MDGYKRHPLYDVLGAIDRLERYIESDFQPCKDDNEARWLTAMLEHLRHNTWQLIESDDTK